MSTRRVATLGGEICHLQWFVNPTTLAMSSNNRYIKARLTIHLNCLQSDSKKYPVGSLVKKGHLCISRRTFLLHVQDSQRNIVAYYQKTNILLP